MKPPARPVSLTDPYDDEPDPEVEPVRLWLKKRDKSYAVVVTDARAMDDKSIVRHGGVLFLYVGTDQRDVPGEGKRWVRLYAEASVIDVGTMTVSERKFP